MVTVVVPVASTPLAGSGVETSAAIRPEATRMRRAAMLELGMTGIAHPGRDDTGSVRPIAGLSQSLQRAGQRTDSENSCRTSPPSPVPD